MRNILSSVRRQGECAAMGRKQRLPFRPRYSASPVKSLCGLLFDGQSLIPNMFYRWQGPCKVSEYLPSFSNYKRLKSISEPFVTFMLCVRLSVAYDLPYSYLSTDSLRYVDTTSRFPAYINHLKILYY